jgi:hypothetical protein
MGAERPLERYGYAVTYYAESRVRTRRERQGIDHPAHRAIAVSGVMC